MQILIGSSIIKAEVEGDIRLMKNIRFFENVVNSYLTTDYKLTQTVVEI